VVGREGRCCRWWERKGVVLDWHFGLGGLCGCTGLGDKGVYCLCVRSFWTSWGSSGLFEEDEMSWHRSRSVMFLMLSDRSTAMLMDRWSTFLVI
jgi:hypothetical protein